MKTMDEWIRYNLNLRKKILKRENGENKYLLANFRGTSQQKDIENRTALIGDFCRAKINIKAFNDEERAKKGLPPFDFSNNEAFFNAFRQEFDMSYWAFIHDPMPIKDLVNEFIYQGKACNIHCPWCYVDDRNRDGQETGGAAWFSMNEIMDMFEAEQKKQPLHIFRPSGGEPTLAPEQWLEALQKIEVRKLKAYIQADTNLMTGAFIRYLSETELVDYFLLDKISDYDNFGLLCSFKGTDTESFLKATGMPAKYAFLEEHRFETFAEYVRVGIDAYPFIYDPNPYTLESFMEKGARMFGDGFYLKTWPLPLKLYGPEKERLAKEKIDTIEYQKKLTENFIRSEEIMQNIIWQKFGVNYKAIPRAGIRLKVK